MSCFTLNDEKVIYLTSLKVILEISSLLRPVSVRQPRPYVKCDSFQSREAFRRYP